MSLLDYSMSNSLGYGNRNNNQVTLPPISSIIKSLESTLPPLVPQQQTSTYQPTTPPVGSSASSTAPSSVATSADTLITNNNNIPTLLPIDSYPTTHYTYNTARSNSSDSLASSPSIKAESHPQAPHVQIVHQPQPQQLAQIHVPQQQPVNFHDPQQLTNKRRYTCKTCTKSFTTSGHLARHSRIHTGERKHICPFPNCESRFARQDNCMQHYKTHLNNKLRKRKYNKKV